MKRIGLALGGGGAKGLCHIAFIRAMDEMGFRPSVISGTSIGAAIGALYAAGVSPYQMQAILKKINYLFASQMMEMAIFKPTGLISGKGIEKFLKANLPVMRFEDLSIPMKIVATDFWSRSQVVIDRGDLIPAIRASISIPALMKPVRMGGSILIDGGAVNPLPYDIIRKDCDLLIAIDVSGEKSPERKDNMPGMFESIMSTFQIMQTSIIKAKSLISKPDILVKPELRNIRFLEFFRYNDIIEGAAPHIEEFKKELSRKMKRLRIF